MVDIAGTSVKPGLWDHLKKFDFKAIMEDIKSQNINWMEVGGYIVAGLVAGFLFKRYFKSVIMILIGGIVLIGLLDHFKLALIDWDHLQSLMGINPTKEAFQDLFQASFAWIKVNTKVVSAFGVGFFAGLKLS
ncbi:MAG: hypothetical protein HQ469_14275 [Cyanobacteria bacterium]|nr:hypothetical protein [Cyanobacteria bacterium bin.275]